VGDLLELEAEAIAELGLSDCCLYVALDEIVDCLNHAGAHAHAIEGREIEARQGVGVGRILLWPNMRAEQEQAHQLRD
jgi:hypothetical protein